jgi:NAD+ synthase
MKMGKELIIDPKAEVEKIVSFLKTTFDKQHFSKAVIGLSGGIDSAISLYLLAKVMDPKNIHVFHLPYLDENRNDINAIINNIKIPAENVHTISLRPIINQIAKQLSLRTNLEDKEKVRLGNIMARTRMIILFDFAKKYDALVVGTENKSEKLLAYFTRFGDGASDIEPIQHLYKTQIFQLADYLKIPRQIIKKAPSAGLWEGQTDEKEFGFTYKEADMVLHLFFNRNNTISEIKKLGFNNVDKVIERVKNNEYKHKTPYRIK